MLRRRHGSLASLYTIDDSVHRWLEAALETPWIQRGGRCQCCQVSSRQDEGSANSSTLVEDGQPESNSSVYVEPTKMISSTLMTGALPAVIGEATQTNRTNTVLKRHLCGAHEDELVDAARDERIARVAVARHNLHQVRWGACEIRDSWAR